MRKVRRITNAEDQRTRRIEVKDQIYGHIAVRSQLSRVPANYKPAAILQCGELTCSKVKLLS